MGTDIPSSWGRRRREHALPSGLPEQPRFDQGRESGAVELKSMIRLICALALVCAGSLGVWVTGASAQATTFPAAGMTIDLGSAPPAGTPGVKIKGGCPSFVFTDDIALGFTSGSGVAYGPTPHPET